MRKRQNPQNPFRAGTAKQPARALLTDADARPAAEILHDLQTSQIELEMQNEALRQSQVNLEEFRDRYVEFYDFAPVGYLTLNHAAQITEINLTGATLLGKERHKLLSRNFAYFLAPEERDIWHQHFTAALEHDGKQTCELSLHRGDDSHLHAQLDSLRLKKNDGSTVVRITLTDITDLKLAEAALHESESHLRMLEQREIVQASLDGFWVINTSNARIQDVNDAFCAMAGYSREELLTMRISDLEADENPAETAAHIKKVMSAGYDRFETRHRHKQGHLINLEISANYSEIDGGIIFVFSRDITERKRAEDILRESEERYRSLFENMIEGYAYCRMLFEHGMPQDFVYLEVNDAFKKLTGLNDVTGERGGKTIPGLFESSPDLLEIYGRVSLTRQPEKFEAYVDSLDAWLSISVYSPRQEYFVAIFENITERKQARRQLRDLTAHLLTVREEEKARIAREIHDEFSGTLSALKIELSRLDRGLSGDMRASPLFARIGSMLQMLDSAIAFTRSFITDLRPTMLDDIGLFAALEWQAGMFSERTGIECRIACISSKDKLDQMLSINLFRIFQETLTNIARHSGASRVEVEFQHADNEVTLSICDNGCGLPEGHSIASTSYGIRGMRERVELLDGTINFDNRPGSGLTVKVKLPLPAIPQ